MRKGTDSRGNSDRRAEGRRHLPTNRLSRLRRCQEGGSVDTFTCRPAISVEKASDWLQAFGVPEAQVVEQHPARPSAPARRAARGCRPGSSVTHGTEQPPVDAITDSCAIAEKGGWPRPWAPGATGRRAPSRWSSSHAVSPSIGVEGIWLNDVVQQLQHSHTCFLARISFVCRFRQLGVCTSTSTGVRFRFSQRRVDLAQQCSSRPLDLMPCTEQHPDEHCFISCGAAINACEKGGKWLGLGTSQEF